MKEKEFFNKEFNEEGALEIFTSRDAEVFRVFLEYIRNNKMVGVKDLIKLRKNVPCKYHVTEILSKMVEVGLISKGTEISSVYPGADFNQSVFYELTKEGADFFQCLLVDV
ncbi:MAG: hypothetical protein R6V40_00300 [Candidatus Moraniibacteriota bacterium]